MAKCKSCGKEKNVKNAYGYPRLAKLLTNWGAIDDGSLLCPGCANTLTNELFYITVVRKKKNLIKAYIYTKNLEGKFRSKA
jgi:hypothetical protein